MGLLANLISPPMPQSPYTDRYGPEGAAGNDILEHDQRIEALEHAVQTLVRTVAAIPTATE